ncbi:MAG: hypothetical protein ACI9N1_003243, partial [Flavobacteriales bacterium]
FPMIGFKECLMSISFSVVCSEQEIRMILVRSRNRYFI